MIAYIFFWLNRTVCRMQNTKSKANSSVCSKSFLFFVFFLLFFFHSYLLLMLLLFFRRISFMIKFLEKARMKRISVYIHQCNAICDKIWRILWIRLFIYATMRCSNQLRTQPIKCEMNWNVRRIILADWLHMNIFSENINWFKHFGLIEAIQLQRTLAICIVFFHWRIHGWFWK